MVTLHILEYLKDNGIGTAIDVDLFFEKLPLNKYGIAIYSRGGEQAHGRNTSMQQFDLYCMGTSDVVGYNQLEKCRELFSASYGNACTLPIVAGVSERQYTNAQFLSILNIENLGTDENERVVFRLGCNIVYRKT